MPTTYGPWLQLPDQTVRTFPAAFFDGPDGEQDETPTVLGVDYTHVESADDEIIVDVPHWNAFKVEIGSAASQESGTDPTSPGAFLRGSHANTRVFTVDGWFDSHNVQRSLQGDLRYLTAADLGWHDSWFLGAPPEFQWPEGADAYEVETRTIGGVQQPVGTPLYATVLVDGEGVQSDGFMTGLELVVTADHHWDSATWNLSSLYGSGPGYTEPMAGLSSGVTPMGPATFEIPLDDWGQPVGPGLFAPVAVWSGIRTPPGATGGFDYFPEDDYHACSVTTQFHQSQAMLDDLVLYTIRPPRIRWRYGPPIVTPPETPAIQQTSHRDDHLAGGAYQTWPPPTSRQMSNQTYGGYF